MNIIRILCGKILSDAQQAQSKQSDHVIFVYPQTELHSQKLGGALA